MPDKKYRTPKDKSYDAKKPPVREDRNETDVHEDIIEYIMGPISPTPGTYMREFQKWQRMPGVGRSSASVMGQKAKVTNKSENTRA